MKKWLILGIVCFILVAQTPVLSALTIDQTVNMTDLLAKEITDKTLGISYDGLYFLVGWNNGTNHIAQINASFNDKVDECDIDANKIVWGLSYSDINNTFLVKRFANITSWWKWVEYDNSFLGPNCPSLVAGTSSFTASSLAGFDVYKNSTGTNQHYLFGGASLKNLVWTRLKPNLQSTNLGFNVANTSQPRWIDVTVKQDSIADDSTATHMWALSGADFNGDVGDSPDLVTKIILREPPAPSESAIYTIDLAEQGFPNIRWLEYDYNNHIWLINDTHGFKWNVIADELGGIGASSITWITPRLNNTNFNFELNTLEARIETATNFTCRIEWLIDEVNETQCAINIIESSNQQIWCNKNFSTGNHTSTINCYDVNNSLQLTNPIAFSVNLGFTGNTGIALREALGLQTAEQGVNVLGLGVWFFIIIIGFIVGKMWGGIVTAMGSAISLAFIGWMNITITITIVVITGFLIATLLRKTFLGGQE